MLVGFPRITSMKRPLRRRLSDSSDDQRRRYTLTFRSVTRQYEEFRGRPLSGNGNDLNHPHGQGSNKKNRALPHGAVE